MTRKNKTMSINPNGGILIILRDRHRGKNNNKHVQTKALNILGTNLGKTTAGTKLVTGETNQMKTRREVKLNTKHRRRLTSKVKQEMIKT